MSGNAKGPADTINIPIEHFKVHNGQMFYLSYTFAAVADSATVEMIMFTGDEPPHVVITATSPGAARISILSNPTSTANGTTLTSYNMCRTSTNVAAAIMTYAPTNATSTTIIVNDYIPGGSTVQTRVGASARQNTEWIFKPNYKYLIRFENLAKAQADYMNLVFEWYED